MNKLKVALTGLIMGASVAASVTVYAVPMLCDMTKCSKVMGGYICEKGACKEIEK
ncbi:hypothetical protein [Colwellia sp. BRX10-4]|jgi:hypothetical protein|uniref:hypothetical protein n=1 Tax=Colwellia sp. BRX10-4 TaxID=2759843 RepID=UPI0015F4F7E6|nr:hypothetical protein [Colwellia sp. BRX10-4]MBA6397612.1 hypothetical protein [Colwellia sp. BRX10-4]